MLPFETFGTVWSPEFNEFTESTRQKQTDTDLERLYKAETSKLETSLLDRLDQEIREAEQAEEKENRTLPRHLGIDPIDKLAAFD